MLALTNAIFELLYPDLKEQAVFTVPTRALANDKLAEWRARASASSLRLTLRKDSRAGSRLYNYPSEFMHHKRLMMRAKSNGKFKVVLTRRRN